MRSPDGEASKLFPDGSGAVVAGCATVASRATQRAL